MANVLPVEKQVAVIAGLAEGLSIRSLERMYHIHRDTIMRLGVRIGEGCQRLLDRIMRDLPGEQFQLDEIWGFISKKQKHVTADDKPGTGDVWTFVSMDAHSKIVPTFRVGKRDGETANAFVADLASRLRNRVQISTDALRAYVEAIELSFGGEVDYGVIVKTFDHAEPALPASSRYSPPKVISVSKHVVVGHPDRENISTSFIEKQNHTMRMHCRRLARLTNAFSKKIENFRAAVGLHFGYYNLVKIHKSLRMTPALAAGVTRELWTVADLVREAQVA